MPPALVANPSTRLKSSSATVEGHMSSATMMTSCSMAERSNFVWPESTVRRRAEVGVFHLLVSLDHAVGHGADGPFGVYPAGANLLLQLSDQVLVFEHQQVRVEYVRVLVAELAGEP